MTADSTPAIGERTTSFTTFADVFRPICDRLFSADGRLSRTLETKLRQARMPQPVDRYLARAIGGGFVAGLVCWLLGAAVGYALSGPSVALGSYLLVAGTGILFGAVGAILGFSSLVILPSARAASRTREINVLLPDAVSFMYALSVGGLDHLELLEAVAGAEDAYGEVALEFQSILAQVEYFGVDYRSAIRAQAHETPSDELSQLLMDLLSTIDSGGDVERFLEEKSERHARTAKQQQERTLDTLELVGELYMTLSLFPLLLVIVVVVMQLVPDAAVPDLLLYLTVYGLIPAIGVGFLVLVSTVKRDEPGDGVLETGRADQRADIEIEQKPSSTESVEQFIGGHPIFTRIQNRERAHKRQKRLMNPLAFFRKKPLTTLALTIPVSALAVGGAIVLDVAGLPWSGSSVDPIRGTIVFLYLPLYLVLTPLAVFHEWNVSHRTAVLATLSEDLRKLSSTNDTGQPLLESLRSVSRTADGRLATEFGVIHTKVSYGRSLDRALIEFANSYRIPRLARTTRLITEAQKATNHITPVLRTVATASENRDDLEQERRSRTRMQVAIIVMTFLTVLTVIAVLQTQFVESLSGLESGPGAASSVGSTSGVEAVPGSGAASSQLATADPGTGIDAGTLSVVFFHAVTLQAILSGFICGYLRTADLLSGTKYVIALATVALGGWLLVS